MKKMKFVVMSLLILGIASVCLCVSSCKKETTSATYPFTALNNSGVNGKIIASKNDTFTDILISIDNAPVFASYDVHFHEGKPAAYKGFAPYTFMNVVRVGTSVNEKRILNMRFADFLNFDGTCVIHPHDSSQVLAKGGVGMNK